MFLGASCSTTCGASPLILLIGDEYIPKIHPQRCMAIAFQVCTKRHIFCTASKSHLHCNEPGPSAAGLSESVMYGGFTYSGTADTTWIFREFSIGRNWQAVPRQLGADAPPPLAMASMIDVSMSTSVIPWLGSFALSCSHFAFSLSL